MLFYAMLERCKAYKNPFTFNPSFLFEGRSTEGPATFSSSTAPNKMLALDALRSAVTPAKSWLLLKLFRRSSFSSPEFYWCFYHPLYLEVK